MLPEAKIQPMSLAELETRYLAFVAHQQALSTKRIHFAHFKRLLGNPLIHTITVEVLDRYRAQRRHQDGVGPATINREVGTLKNALTKAVEWRLLRKSAREDLAAVKKFQEPDGRLRYLSGPLEAQRLIDACNPWLRPIVMTTLHTGMRKGEVLGLTWDLIDLEHGFIRPKRTKNGRNAGAAP